MVTGDGHWRTCVGGQPAPPGLSGTSRRATPAARSAGPSATPAPPRQALLLTPVLDLSSVTTARASYAFRLTDSIASESGKVEPLDGGSVTSGATTYVLARRRPLRRPAPVLAGRAPPLHLRRRLQRRRRQLRRRRHPRLRLLDSRSAPRPHHWPSPTLSPPAMQRSLPSMSGRGIPVAMGDVLLGKYRVERVLGKGGMGVVVAARHLDLDELFAVKLMLDPEASPEAIERFLREARAAAKLKGEHVARVQDVGRLPDDTPFMVIEYLEGSDLAQELSLRGPLPLADAVDWILQALEALVEAHVQGIVHRDLKPSNLFLARQPDGTRILKVLDFGISKQHGDTAQGVSLTKTHSLIGSPLYMAPEQVLAAKDVDPRSDLWSLGVVLFELLVGHTPFDGANVGAVLSNVLSASIPSLRELRPDLPRPFDALLRACLARPLAERYPDWRRPGPGPRRLWPPPWAPRSWRASTPLLPGSLAPPGPRSTRITPTPSALRQGSVEDVPAQMGVAGSRRAWGTRRARPPAAGALSADPRRPGSGTHGVGHTEAPSSPQGQGVPGSPRRGSCRWRAPRGGPDGRSRWSSWSSEATARMTTMGIGGVLFALSASPRAGPARRGRARGDSSRPVRRRRPPWSPPPEPSVIATPATAAGQAATSARSRAGAHHRARPPRSRSPGRRPQSGLHPRLPPIRRRSTSHLRPPRNPPRPPARNAAPSIEPSHEVARAFTRHPVHLFGLAVWNAPCGRPGARVRPGRAVRGEEGARALRTGHRRARRGQIRLGLSQAPGGDAPRARRGRSEGDARRMLRETGEARERLETARRRRGPRRKLDKRLARPSRGGPPRGTPPR